jgi:hypothetical protein
MPASAQRLEHEYTLKGELDSAWPGRPVELSEHNNRTTLVLCKLQVGRRVHGACDII